MRSSLSPGGINSSISNLSFGSTESPGSGLYYLPAHIANQPRRRTQSFTNPLQRLAAAIHTPRRSLVDISLTSGYNQVSYLFSINTIHILFYK